MPVVFNGGPSGMRNDYLPPVPSSGKPQPILRTQTSGPVPSSINFTAERFDAPRPSDATRTQFATPDFMPTGANHVGPNETSDPSTDIMDPGVSTGPWGPGVNAVNTPYTGPGSGR